MDYIQSRTQSLNLNDIDLRCMTINVGAAGKTGKNAAEEKKIREKVQGNRPKKVLKNGKEKLVPEAEIRREIFVEKIKQVDPDIICFQEQIPTDLNEVENVMLSNLLKDLPEYLRENFQAFYEQKGSLKQAAVMVKKSVIEEGSITRIDFTKDVDKQDYDEIEDRMVLIKVTLDDSMSDFYIASWHGPHKKYGKIAIAENIMKIVTRKVGRSPFIIGGDFNLPQKDFPDASNYISIAADSNDIDYFVYWRYGYMMTDVKKSPYNDPQVARAFLDHVPTVGRFQRR